MARKKKEEVVEEKAVKTPVPQTEVTQHLDRDPNDPRVVRQRKHSAKG